MNKNLHQLIFPQLDDASWSHVDLNRLAQLTNPEVFQGGEALNPFLDPYFTENWLKDVIHPNLDCEYSYGGYLENRGKIWQGSYITSKASFHLGIDFNVPTGTTVHAPQDCEVVETIEDGETHGWGNRITFKLENGLYFVFGHMSRRRVVQRGDKIKSGDLVGYVGCPQDNGWWFEHLHVQCLRKEIFEGKAFDGYSKYYDGITSDFPDPELVLGQEIEQSE